MIYAKDGSTYTVSHWSDDGKTIYLADGTTVGWNRGTITKADGSTVQMDHYEVLGTKYVPVRVATSDLADFCSKYTVVENGGQLVGGYSEKNLTAYTLTAAVDENTNGLKYATKSGDGYTFSAAHNGTGSGVAEAAQKAADGLTVNLRSGSDVGSFGEFIRVDLNGNYGELGSRMQSVVWTYYGNDSTYTHAKASYGTKFAADNWMHKSMGIQLGLTDSLRFQLPEGTDGTGKWEITIYALGYSDSTFTVNMTADNVAEKVEKITDDQKTQLRALAARAQAYLDNANTKYTTNATRDALNEHAGEAADMLANADASKAEAASLIDELTKYLNELDEANASTKTVTGSAPVTGYKYNAQVTVTFDSKGKVVSVVDNNTQPSKNSSTYWNLLSGLTSAKNNFWEQFNGLDKAGVSALRIDPTDDDEHEGESNFDAVSGATYSSKAVQNAVLDAFNNLSNN